MSLGDHHAWLRKRQPAARQGPFGDGATFICPAVQRPPLGRAGRRFSLPDQSSTDRHASYLLFSSRHEAREIPARSSTCFMYRAQRKRQAVGEEKQGDQLADTVGSR